MNHLADTLTLSDDARRIAARGSMEAFTTYTFPDYQVNWHHSNVCKTLDAFIDGTIKRLIIIMPPRHGKSELVSRRLPPKIFGKFPDKSVISCSYAATLAKKMCKDVKRIMDSDRYSNLYPDTVLPTGKDQNEVRQADYFDITGHRGFYACAGVDGGINGIGFNYGIIDDPIKNRKEAESETVREAVWDWYTSTFFSRMEKNASILITSTRWHNDDLVGRILEKDKDNKWTIVHYSAVRHEDDINNPKDPREIGEPLWPWKRPLSELNEIKETGGSRDWESLYQGRPAMAEGVIWKREWWNHYHYPDGLPQTRILRVIHSWDTAFKKGKDNAKNANVISFQYATGLYLVRVVSFKSEFHELDARIRTENAAIPAHAILLEDKSSGITENQVLKKETTLSVVPINPEGDKEARAHVSTPFVQAGNVYVPENAPWAQKFEDAMAAFPSGKYKDIPDAFSQLIEWIITHPVRIGLGSMRSRKVNFENRGL